MLSDFKVFNFSFNAGFTWRLLGKASVPNEVNDRVAPQGYPRQLIHVG